MADLNISASEAITVGAVASNVALVNRINVSESIGPLSESVAASPGAAFMTTQVTSYAGTEAVVYVAATPGNRFLNTGAQWLRIYNAHASQDRTITIITQQTVENKAVDDQSVVISPQTAAVIGPFRTTLYNLPADNNVYITFSSTADLSIEIFTLGAIGS